MNTLLINTIGYLIVPITAVALIIVSLVLLFAREHAYGVLRQLYIYGVVITAFLISMTAIIGVLYTGLTTTLLPTNDLTSRYIYDSELRYLTEQNTDPAVYAYLKQEQDKMNVLADTESFRQEWRNQLAWSVPLLLVFLPILLSYRRFLTRS